MKKTSEEILKEIDQMENSERWDLLEKLFYKFFNKEHISEEVKQEESSQGEYN